MHGAGRGEWSGGEWGVGAELRASREGDEGRGECKMDIFQRARFFVNSHHGFSPLCCDARAKPMTIPFALLLLYVHGGEMAY